MADAIPSRTRILNMLETLAIGTAGGALFLWAHLPGGLISGAMIAVGIAAIAGRPLAVPPIMTQIVLVLLGISLGSLMSRQLLQHVSAYPVTIALLALATFCSTFGSSLYLQRFHGWTGPLPSWREVLARCHKSSCSPSRRARTCRRSRWCRPCA